MTKDLENQPPKYGLCSQTKFKGQMNNFPVPFCILISTNIF